jgi:hypothetical protein
MESDQRRPGMLFPEKYRAGRLYLFTRNENISMSKKTRGGYKGTQRSKPKIQKRVELVRPERPSPRAALQSGLGTEGKPLELANADTSIVMTLPVEANEDRRTTRKGSAYARGTPRRPIQKASAIITPEDFIYVKRDLIRIGILSSIMIAALIVLTFIIGVN